MLTASLDNAINAGSARQGDRITLTVRNAPRAEWNNAVIEGYLVGAPTRSGGRTSVTIDFDRIRFATDAPETLTASSLVSAGRTGKTSISTTIQT